jgi:hypothetical protein
MERDAAKVVVDLLAMVRQRVVSMEVPAEDQDEAKVQGLLADLVTRSQQFAKIVGREDKQRIQLRIAELQAEIARLQSELGV